VISSFIRVPGKIRPCFSRFIKLIFIFFYTLSNGQIFELKNLTIKFGNHIISVGGVIFMRKSIKNKIAIMLALFGTVSQKTYANNYTGWIVGGVTALGLGLGIGISGYYLFGGKSKDENNKVKSQEQQNLEQSIKDFLDSLPKDNKRLPSYLVFDNPIGDVGKVGCFGAAKDIFKQYVLKQSGGKCVSNQEDLIITSY